MFKIFKIAVASVVAIFLSDLIGLQYSSSAAIITFLTIQKTKRETIILSFKRILSFFLASALAFITFYFLDYTLFAFGIFLFVFIWSVNSLKLAETISTSAVIATHYLMSDSITFSFFIEEFLLILISVGIGTFVNLIMPKNIKKIQKIQHSIEDDMQAILHMMAENIQLEDKESYNNKSFEPLLEDIQRGIDYAYAHMNNNILQESRYFITYMEMRKQQCLLLENIYQQIGTLKIILPQTNEVSQLLKQLSHTLHHFNNTHDLLIICEEFEDHFHKISLPTNRTEFETCATLFMIGKDLFYFLEMKEEFAVSLTLAQKEQYWKL